MSDLATMRRALVRLCWNLIADHANCTCYPNDVCPACEAYRALGYGRKWDLKRAAKKLGKEKRS